LSRSTYLSRPNPTTTTRLFAFILLLCSLSLHAATKPAAPEAIEGASNLSAEQVVKLLLSNPNLLIVDSRKKTEYLKGHIEGSINMLNTKMTQHWLESMAADKSRAILFYCNGQRCMRSSDAVNKALSWGYKNVYWFRGGWKEWIDKRLPVVSD